ncbi:MAG TPA: DUF3180 domain-containing protein [Pseudonocardiaceae bacterium]|nr:DUF3180 domain-containing protein [Pseudonocardiaceae bacterium]
MRPTRISDLLAALAVAALVTSGLLRLVYDDLPTLPTLAGVSLGVLAIGEAVFGHSLRTRIRERPRTVQPFTAVRAVVLAKASSLLGALMAGWWLGVLGYVVPRRDEFEAASSDTVSAVVGLLCALALAAAGLWLEYCCRTPDDRDQVDENRTADGW